jgi:hypothetical protein
VDLRRLADERFGVLAQQGEQLAADVQEHNVAIEQDLEAEAPDPGEFDWPDPPEGWDDPLLDTSREYVEQVDRYKEHQGKKTARKARVFKAQLSLVCTVCGTTFNAYRRDARVCSDARNGRAQRDKRARHP